jgi:hypothetical protein
MAINEITYTIRLEWYIERLFNNQHFKTRKWYRSKTTTDLQSLFDYGNPDLQMELVFTDNKSTSLQSSVSGGPGLRMAKFNGRIRRKLKSIRGFKVRTG